MTGFRKNSQEPQEKQKKETFETSLKKVMLLMEKYPHFRTYLEDKIKDEIKYFIFANSTKREVYLSDVHRKFVMSGQGIDRIMTFAPQEVVEDLFKMESEHGPNLLGMILTQIAENENYYSYREFSRAFREEMR